MHFIHLRAKVATVWIKNPQRCSFNVQVCVGKLKMLEFKTSELFQYWSSMKNCTRQNYHVNNTVSWDAERMEETKSCRCHFFSFRALLGTNVARMVNNKCSVMHCKVWQGKGETEFKSRWKLLKTVPHKCKKYNLQGVVQMARQ